jgi:hypothetical protein
MPLLATSVPSQPGDRPVDHPDYRPIPGAPLSNQPELIPAPVRALAATASAYTSPIGGGQEDGPVDLIGGVDGTIGNGQGKTTAIGYPKKLTDYMDAPARAAMSEAPFSRISPSSLSERLT